MTVTGGRRLRRGSTVAVVAAGSLLLGGCSVGDDKPEAEPGREPPSARTTPVAAPVSEAASVDPSDPALDVALSTPVEDRVYPDVGDPGVDALHYQLDLAWTPDSRTLDAVETLVFRAARDADHVQLDFGESLTATTVELDGRPAGFEQDGKNLVVRAPMTRDDRHTLQIQYTGTPEPVAAPTTRSDFNTLGWTTTDQSETWTMQEPFGAYSWYAVNDHPSDKALYDFTISTPAPWVGVANGLLESREEVEGNTVTAWHLDEPAASYLVTAAVGDLKMTRDKSDSGVPMTYWTPRGDDAALRSVQVAGRELDWIEDRLGPYPFSSLGILVVDSQSGMETQTMITLGNEPYTLSPEVLVHEMVHQWYGDQVTPQDWRDVWMSEGMTTYLQAIWESENDGIPLEETLRSWAEYDQEARDEAGAPADYDPPAFGEGNVYYLPALMWDQLRTKIGDDEFWALVRKWPKANDNGNANRQQWTTWIEERTGEELSSFFDAWLLGTTSPPYS